MCACHVSTKNLSHRINMTGADNAILAHKAGLTFIEYFMINASVNLFVHCEFVPPMTVPVLFGIRLFFALRLTNGSSRHPARIRSRCISPGALAGIQPEFVCITVLNPVMFLHERFSSRTFHFPFSDKIIISFLSLFLNFKCVRRKCI